jgi:hypothetical protein
MGELDDKEMVASCLGKALVAYERAQKYDPDGRGREAPQFTAHMTEANYWLLTATFFRIGQVAKLR